MMKYFHFPEVGHSAPLLVVSQIPGESLEAKHGAHTVLLDSFVHWMQPVCVSRCPALQGSCSGKSICYNLHFSFRYKETGYSLFSTFCRM
jgi:hypothetical protein